MACFQLKEKNEFKHWHHKTNQYKCKQVSSNEKSSLRCCADASSSLLPVSVCKDVSSEHEERSSCLLQEEPQPPHIEEEAEGSTLTLRHGKTSHTLPGTKRIVSMFVSRITRLHNSAYSPPEESLVTFLR